MTVNECWLTDIITRKLMFVQLSVVTLLSDMHSRYFAQVRWLIMTVNEHLLTAIITVKLMFLQLSSHYWVMGTVDIEYFSSWVRTDVVIVK